MKLLLYEWNAYMQGDLEVVLHGMGVEYETFSCEMGRDVGVEDEYFIRNFGRVLREGSFDAVMSLNFWNSVAIVCQQERTPYIAWGYDCPLSPKIESMLHFPTNYLFVFDKTQLAYYQKKGFKQVYHLPLAVNVERLDRMYLSKEEKEALQTDISFVGNMYGSSYQSFKNCLTEYEKGYFEGLIETQYRIYGDYYITEFISDEMLRTMRERMNKEKHISNPDSFNELEFRVWVTETLAREITRRERILLISALSKRHSFNLYSTEPEEILKHVNFCGPVSSFLDMPKVFKASKINLNITYKQIAAGMPLRVLDIMGAGGFLLSNYQEELAETFRPGVDCVIYESIEDAIAKAEYYLKHEEERLEIAHNGHEAAKRFSYEKQLEQIFRIALGV